MFLKLINQGKNSAEIGKVLGRRPSTVRAHKSNLKIKKPKSADIVCIHPAVRILSRDVPDWYELGWRFAGFIPGGLCRMEWRSERPERRPACERELVAA